MELCLVILKKKSWHVIKHEIHRLKAPKAKMMTTDLYIS